ncbi:late embryogenesis abundant protein D-34-like [Morus notabilis]|uniref:late embryogenesis abundant protein D-34-like n=1 Tax=Morus notabilis TaxID=981085 RepID=UPI000CED7A47|nr:late embryogenesis abundant protein D-34-like [Morus notabilis]
MVVEVGNGLSASFVRPITEVEQPRRPQAGRDEEAVKYGDVFNVSGELASKTVAPRDAAMMQSAETTVLGQTQKGGPAATMQSAATQNERAGVVGHVDASDAAEDRGVSVTETDVPGYRIVTESVAGQVVGQYVQPTPAMQAAVVSAITIGEALEATAKTAGDKPVDQSDAAAIQAAEVRATGSNVITPGGLAATAQSAASFNAAIERDENKIKLRDILTDATSKLPADKAATRRAGRRGSGERGLWHR